MNLISDRQRFLQDELNTYEKTTQMNETERSALHEWVAAGNSVHENTCNAEDGHGNYIDFLDVYREEQDIRPIAFHGFDRFKANSTVNTAHEHTTDNIYTGIRQFCTALPSGLQSVSQNLKLLLLLQKGNQ